MKRLEDDIRSVHTQMGMLELTFKNLQGAGFAFTIMTYKAVTDATKDMESKLV